MQSKRLIHLILFSALMIFSLVFSADAANQTHNRLIRGHIAQSVKLQQLKNHPQGNLLLSKLSTGSSISNGDSTGFGSISGKVIGLDSTAIGTAYIEAFTVDSVLYNGQKGLVLIDSDFTYRIDGLVPGKFYLIAWAYGYELQYYDGAANMEQADQVEVRQNQVTENIDFDMKKPVPGTGKISGVVQNEEDYHPIAGATVFVYSYGTSYGTYYYGESQTDEEGKYSVSELKSGDYYVQVYAEGYISEYYNDVSDFSLANPVSVQEPGEAAGIDFLLSAGGSISGRVIDDEGNPIQNAYIQATPFVQDSMYYPTRLEKSNGGSAVTDDDGQYLIYGLEGDDYYVSATVWGSMYSVMEWYDNAQSLSDATLVNVQRGVEISNIDFQIAVPQEGNQTISGRVTDLDNNPVVNASIYVQTAYYMTGYSFWSCTTTDQDGNYRVEKVPAGNYYVSCWAQISWQSVYQWWPDAELIDQANLVTVEYGSPKEAIDFHLPLSKQTASISGIVRSEDGHPLANATVQLSTYQGTASKADSTWLWAYGSSDINGDYTISDLYPGTYTLYASCWEYDNFGQEWYDGKTSKESATPIVLEKGEHHENINFALDVHPIYGTLVGTITDSSTGAPINRAYVEITPIYNDIGSRCFMAWDYHTTTDKNGRYIVEWLTEGEYRIAVYADGGFAYYKNSIVSETATLIEITGGETVTADMALTLRNDGTGVISGRVTTDYEWGVYDSTTVLLKRNYINNRTTADGSPVDMAIVIAKPTITVMTYPQSEMFYTALTNADGTYELKGLPAGEYYVSSFASYCLLEYFDNVFDPSEASKVHVDGITPTIDIDFALYPMLLCRDATENESGFKYNTSVNIFGKVEDEEGNSIEGAVVYLLDDTQLPISYVSTSSDGSYEIDAIPESSDYYIQASKLGYKTQYNGNTAELSQTVPLNVINGLNEVNFVLAPRGGSGIQPPEPSKLPESIELYGSYPNPFNPETTIRFALPTDMHIDLRIFNPLGQEVATLWNGTLKAGQHDILWNGCSQNGEALGSGLYIYRLESPVSVHSGKMLLTR